MNIIEDKILPRIQGRKPDRANRRGWEYEDRPFPRKLIEQHYCLIFEGRNK